MHFFFLSTRLKKRRNTTPRNGRKDRQRKYVLKKTRLFTWFQKCRREDFQKDGHEEQTAGKEGTLGKDEGQGNTWMGNLVSYVCLPLHTAARARVWHWLRLRPPPGGGSAPSAPTQAVKEIDSRVMASDPKHIVLFMVTYRCFFSLLGYIFLTIIGYFHFVDNILLSFPLFSSNFEWYKDLCTCGSSIISLLDG